VPRLIWSEEAHRDIAAISEYLRQFDGALAAFPLEAIGKSAEMLTRFPAIGPALGSETRSLRARQTNYVIVYAIRDEGIVILHIHHDRHDWRAT
jgi:plasmid stabilization system protein ParE